MLSLLRQHPNSISTANTAYQQQLCSGLCVQDPAAATLPPASAAVVPAVAAAAVPVGASSVVTQAASAAVTIATAATAAPAAADSVLQTAPAIIAGSVEFIPQLDMFGHCIAEPVGAAVAITEQKAAEHARTVAIVKADAAAASLRAASEAAAAQAAAAEAAAAAAAAAEAKASKGSKDAKGKPAAVGKPKEASSATDKSGKGGKKAAADKAAADAAAVEPPVAAFEFEFGGVRVPLDQHGAALCLDDSLPDAVIKQVLQILQAHFLEDMVTFCEEIQTGGHSWAGDQEVAATEELEARLRSHRCSCCLSMHGAFDDANFNASCAGAGLMAVLWRLLSCQLHS